MKLRIRKTGEVVDAYSIDSQAYETIKIQYFTKNGVLNHFSFDSLEALNNVLEDYKPAEPLIKDEKIRKAVRAWAKACRLKYATYEQSSNEFYDPDTRGKFAIKFTLKPIEVLLDDGKCYTIAELCGEEEE